MVAPRVIKRTPREGAAVLRRWAVVAVGVGVACAAAAAALPALTAAASILAAVVFVGAIMLAGIASTRTSRSPELVWILAGILVFWVANSTLYLFLFVQANTRLDNTVPSRETIALLSTLFMAGVIALVAAALVAVFGWVLRPGRWHLMNGPGGQS
jgi:uncharacterized membrane protein